MTKELIIVVLILALLYLYHQNKKLKGLPNLDNSTQTIYELDEDLIADKDEAIRKKNEAEQEALDLGNKLKLKQQEVSRKDQEIKRLKSEKSQSEIALNGKIKELKQNHQDQLKAINVLFDEQAKDYKTIDFAELYSLLEKLAKNK